MNNKCNFETSSVINVITILDLTWEHTIHFQSFSSSAMSERFSCEYENGTEYVGTRSAANSEMKIPISGSILFISKIFFGNRLQYSANNIVVT